MADGGGFVQNKMDLPFGLQPGANHRSQERADPQAEQRGLRAHVFRWRTR